MTKKPDCYKQRNDFQAGEYCVEAQRKMIYHWSVWFESIIRENPREKNRHSQRKFNAESQTKAKSNDCSIKPNRRSYVLYVQKCLHASQLSFFFIEKDFYLTPNKGS